jgi:uncharacterized protein DUF6916
LLTTLARSGCGEPDLIDGREGWHHRIRGNVGSAAIGEARMDELIKIEHFEPHVGKTCRFKGTPYALALDRISSNRRRLPKGVKRRPFTVIFRAPRQPAVLPEGLYECEIEGGPTFSIYVNPIFTPAPDHQEYQAVFN